MCQKMLTFFKSIYMSTGSMKSVVTFVPPFREIFLREVKLDDFSHNISVFITFDYQYKVFILKIVNNIRFEEFFSHDQIEKFYL